MKDKTENVKKPDGVIVGQVDLNSQAIHFKNKRNLADYEATNGQAVYGNQGVQTPGLQLSQIAHDESRQDCSHQTLIDIMTPSAQNYISK